jgi:hypothetical protein
MRAIGHGLARRHAITQVDKVLSNRQRLRALMQRFGPLLPDHVVLSQVLRCL